MKTDDDLTRDLVRAFPVGPGQLSRLHGRLAAAAQAEGVLDVAYRTVDTPVGPLLLAATDLGLVRVAYVSEDHDAVLRVLGERISPRILHAPARLDTVVRQIEEYFEGGRHSFDVPLDWRLSNGFRQIVLRHLPDIGYGHTASYAIVAQLAGRPGPSAPWAPRVRPTRCRSSCPATAWCVPTAAWAATSAESRPSEPCSPWKRRHNPGSSHPPGFLRGRTHRHRRRLPAVRGLYARRLPDMEGRPMILNSSATRLAAVCH